MKIETITCDIEKCDNEVKPPTNSILKQEYKKTSLQVIFTSEQTEGRSVKPYLEIAHIDICITCMENVLSGQAIWANGAQGHNTYYFKS